MAEKQHWVMEIAMDNPSSTRKPPTNSKSQFLQLWNDNNNACLAYFTGLLWASHKTSNMIAIIASSFIEHLGNKHMHRISWALAYFAIKTNLWHEEYWSNFAVENS